MDPQTQRLQAAQTLINNLVSLLDKRLSAAADRQAVQTLLSAASTQLAQINQAAASAPLVAPVLVPPTTTTTASTTPSTPAATASS